MKKKSQILKLAKDIRLVIFDVDGVLTDGTLYLTDENIEIKGFHSHDGLGIRMLQTTGVRVAVITARTSEVVMHRMKSLGVQHIYQGNLNKVAAYEHVMRELQLTEEQVVFMGDDLADLTLMSRSKLGIAPANAVDFVKQRADWVTTAGGGHGAAREVCELIMSAQGTLEKAFEQLING